MILLNLILEENWVRELLLKVKDIMHSKEKFPSVNQDENLANSLIT